MTLRVAALVVAFAVSMGASAQPSCGPPTPRDAEGPFYKPGAPKRSSLAEPGAKGERLLLSGTVYTRDCKPVPHALLDFWQTDEKGDYDNAGFRYRGQMLADASGRYRLETVLPGEYPGRPRHIHVKVQAPGGRVLTTQIYFGNSGAPAKLTAKVAKREGALQAVFDFVLQ
ncbi:MAG: intradiol ring-cleavage dioxygenase [Betaproteobacteria bacterium]|nr:MAG: intradiol ring-cleavage dioxygenase [Betaproteobacteria bacterium]